MKVFKLDKASTAKRKDLEGIIFIETDDHGTLFTDNLDRELWEFDYDIIKQGPNKSDKYKFENYPDKMIESLDARSRSLIDKINEFIDKYSLRFSKIHTFNGKTWNKVDLERIPPVNSGNRMFAEKEKLLEYYHTYTVFGGIDEISDKDAAEKLKPDDHAHYRILQKDSHGNISPISDKEIGLAIHRLDGFKLTDLGPASDAMLKGIAGLMQDIYIGKYDKNSANHTADVHQTQSGTPSDDIITLQQDADGVWGNGIKSESIFSRYDPVSYIKKYVSKYISEYIPSWKKIKRYSAVGALTLGLLLGSLHIGNKTCTNYGFAQPVQRTEILHDAHNTKQKDISDISSVPRNYNILQSPVNIQSMQESVQYNDKDTDKDENNLSERLDDFRTKKIGPTSSMISNLKDVSVENGNIDFTIGSRGNADEVYAFFGGSSGNGGNSENAVYRAKLDNGKATFKMPLKYRVNQKELANLNIIAGYEVDGWLHWTSSWKFDVSNLNLNDRTSYSDTGVSTVSTTLDDILDISNTQDSSGNAIEPAPKLPAQDLPANAPAQNQESNQKFNQELPPVSSKSSNYSSATSPAPSLPISNLNNPDTIDSTLDSRIEQQYIILINKHYQKASVFSVNGHGDYSFITAYSVSTGINLGNKERLGDNRTPEGVFRITDSVDTRDWTFGGERAYGSWGLRMNCGSWDSAGNHNDKGRCSIMMHGTPSDEPYSSKYVSMIGTPASHGCIRFYDQDMLELKSRYARVGTQVIIYDSRDLSSKVLEEVIEQDQRSSNSRYYRSIRSSPSSAMNNYFNPSGEYARYSSRIIDNDMGQWLYNERVSTGKTRAELSGEFSDRYHIGDQEKGISKYAFYKIMDDYAAQNDIVKARKIQKIVNA